MKVWIALAAWVLVSLSAGLVGSQFTPGEWYEGLDKPSWNPPSWVFGPVWTALYILMGVAAWMVWRERGFGGSSPALYVFLAQLVLNGLWSYLFFGANSPMWAFFEILALEALIIVTLVLFWRIRTAAGVLLLPYALWVAFASVLNLTLWRMNA
ncbi:MAG: TspO/MBR family protein [Candidatus Fermentibacterota bacterium]